MRRKKAFKRGRVISILVAGSLGYMAGVWHAAAIRGSDLSAAQNVSLRFPLDWPDAEAVAATSDAAPAAPNAAVVGDAQLALLSPEPMVATAPPQAAPPQAGAAPAAAAETADVENHILVPAQRPVAAPVAEAKTIVAPVHRRAERPGLMLNDAQIASIKQRLHMTADQERMWPAVEAALRNIAYARARDAHRRGVPATTAQLASADPNSVEVQGLKSAAIPLLMSFNDEQRGEVRNLAHVMGLDQLATQF
jgi:hypothetical protein